jgi:hypothetical protein
VCVARRTCACTVRAVSSWRVSTAPTRCISCRMGGTLAELSPRLGISLVQVPANVQHFTCSSHPSPRAVWRSGNLGWVNGCFTAVSGRSIESFTSITCISYHFAVSTGGTGTTTTCITSSIGSSEIVKKSQLEREICIPTPQHTVSRRSEPPTDFTGHRDCVGVRTLPKDHVHTICRCSMRVRVRRAHARRAAPCNQIARMTPQRRRWGP